MGNLYKVTCNRGSRKFVKFKHICKKWICPILFLFKSLNTTLHFPTSFSSFSKVCFLQQLILKVVNMLGIKVGYESVFFIISMYQNFITINQLTNFEMLNSNFRWFVNMIYCVKEFLLHIIHRCAKMKASKNHIFSLL